MALIRDWHSKVSWIDEGDVCVRKNLVQCQELAFEAEKRS